MASASPGPDAELLVQLRSDNPDDVKAAIDGVKALRLGSGPRSSVSRFVEELADAVLQAALTTMSNRKTCTQLLIAASELAMSSNGR